ncbi:MAG: hypothetical protein ACK2UL_01155 [Anaerolineae bacterium]
MPADRTAESDEGRGFGSFVLLIGLAFVVLIVVYVYVGRLSRSAGPSVAGEELTTASGAAPDGSVGAEWLTARDASPGAGAAGSASVEPGLLPTQPHSDAQIVAYRDERSGFRLDVLDTWLPVVVEPPADRGEQDRDSYDVVFVSGDGDGGERLAVLVRPDPEDGALARLADSLVPGLAPVDSRAGANATIADRPAALLWRDESPVAPAQYAAVLADEGRTYVIAYSAARGGEMIQEFLRALVTFELGEDESADTVPPIPSPSGLYFHAFAPRDDGGAGD